MVESLSEDVLTFVVVAIVVVGGGETMRPNSAFLCQCFGIGFVPRHESDGDLSCSSENVEV